MSNLKSAEHAASKAAADFVFVGASAHAKDAIVIAVYPDGTYGLRQYVNGQTDAGWGVLSRDGLDKALLVAVAEVSAAAVSRAPAL